MSQGWVCVHRQLLDNAIFKNDKLFRVFMYCLLKASYADGQHMVGDSVVNLKSGQLATGRKAISRDTGLTEQKHKNSPKQIRKDGNFNHQTNHEIFNYFNK